MIWSCQMSQMLRLCAWAGCVLGVACAGDLTARYQLALERIEHGGPPRFDVAFVTADAEPRHVRRFTEFSGDVSGRYLDAMATASRMGGLPVSPLAPGARRGHAPAEAGRAISVRLWSPIVRRMPRWR